jgi:RNA polymerase sigma-70 factor (ECF subfamily)
MKMSEPPPSLELIGRASTGEVEAVEALLQHYLPQLGGFVARRAGGDLRAHESVADLTQSVCREVLQSLRSGRLHFQDEPRFKQWLYRAALMKLANRRRHWRVAGRDAVVLGPAGVDSEAPEPFVESGTPSAEAAFHEGLERFADAFEQLDPAQREVIALHHLEGLPHAEIARRMGCSESYSRSLLSRALARLARLAAASG